MFQMISIPSSFQNQLTDAFIYIYIYIYIYIVCVCVCVCTCIVAPLHQNNKKNS